MKKVFTVLTILSLSVSSLAFADENEVITKESLGAEVNEAIAKVQRYQNDPLRRALWLNEVVSLCEKARATKKFRCNVDIVNN